MTTTSTACNHITKVRCLGSDPRQYRCFTGNEPPRGCGARFVEGRSWVGEPKWIDMPATTSCEYCLDGFCTSVDNAPCPRCGAVSQRPKVGPACNCDWALVSRTHRDTCPLAAAGATR